MPSVKPSHSEIGRLRKERNYFEPHENIFSGLYQKCRSVLEGGYVTKERAKMLRAYLKTNNKLASVFPNNLLCRMLDVFCEKDGWSPDNEGMLLDFIARFYLDCSLEDQTAVGVQIVVSSDMTIASRTLSVQDHPELIKPPDIQLALVDLISDKGAFSQEVPRLLFDRMPDQFVFKKYFVGVTGNFNGYTRKSCFQDIRRFGGVPCDPSYFMDYFFVAKKSVDQNIFSNKLSEAITFRRLYGNPLIFTEDDWVNGLQRFEVQAMNVT